MLPYNILQLKNWDESTTGVRYGVAAFRTILDHSLLSFSIYYFRCIRVSDHSCALGPHWIGPALEQRLCILPQPFLIHVSLNPALKAWSLVHQRPCSFLLLAELPNPGWTGMPSGVRQRKQTLLGKSRPITRWQMLGPSGTERATLPHHPRFSNHPAPTSSQDGAHSLTVSPLLKSPGCPCYSRRRIFAVTWMEASNKKSLFI